MTLVEEEYLDVLQNIEWAILSVYRENPQLFDYDVDKALNALWMGYRSEQIGKAKPPPAFNELQDLLYERVRAICEWRLGRNPMQKEGEDGEVVDLSPEPLKPSSSTNVSPSNPAGAAPRAGFPARRILFFG
ncbi:MAG: hypothetical protein M5U11_14870 [Anaerolineales bacterium]|jgi:hypothetical protein|nr:hypothetical protein [Anaerolineales bacterium]GER79670.1 conserved hypothetical protein [Candidatus Denitrolinea symbiosum]